MRRRSPGTLRATALDPDETLFEVGSREVWQSLLTTSDGVEVGPVIRQVVEAEMYTVRYLVVYDVRQRRHVLLPSDTIVDITDSFVYSNLSADDIRQMPAFVRQVDRGYEERLHQAVGRTPYWIDEATARSPLSAPAPSGDDPQP